MKRTQWQRENTAWKVQPALRPALHRCVLALYSRSLSTQIRGARARTELKKDVLWQAWNELDWREESELMSSHGAYEALKKAVKDRQKSDEAEEKKGASEGKKLRATSPKKTKAKKGRRASLSGEEAEAALGLLLRDQDPLTFTVGRHCERGTVAWHGGVAL